MIFSSKNRGGASDKGSGLPESIEHNRIMALLAQDYLKERRARRRWGLFFRFLVIAYIGVVTWMYFADPAERAQGAHTAVVDINGTIGLNFLTAEHINDSLRDAFAAEDSAGVVIRINSPGGTPVQAARVNQEIQRLKAKYPDKPVYAAVDDICASGGYYVAVAADEIFAHPSSIVGSIGVLMNSFGFTGAMRKLGIERRLLTAGDNKAMLDPFSPANPEHEAHARDMLDDVHQQFITAVREGRGERLIESDDTFSGLFWSGEKARTLGLVDQFGSADLIARDIIGESKIVNYTYRPGFFDAFAARVGTAITEALLMSGISLR